MKTFIYHLFSDELKTLLGLFLGETIIGKPAEINTEEKKGGESIVL